MQTASGSVQKLKALARELDTNVTMTPRHCEKVADYCVELCKAMEIRGKKRNIIVTAGLIHDIGKLPINPTLWIKKEKLSDSEWRTIQLHSVISARMAKEAGCDEKIVEALYYHHVWYNGKGYPDIKKKGKRIPISARILAICDAYDSMTSKRPYREPFSPERAVEELLKYSIKQFDPAIVETFIKVIEKKDNEITADID